MLLDIMRTGLFLLAGPDDRRSLPTSRRTAWVVYRSLFLCGSLALATALVLAKDATKSTNLWSLKPLVRPEIPRDICSSTNPIDAFIGEACRDKGLSPLGAADKLTWLRRVSFDLIGLPPSVEEQDSFARDE